MSQLAQKAEPELDHDPVRILIVDDHPDNVRALVSIVASPVLPPAYIC